MPHLRLASCGYFGLAVVATIFATIEIANSYDRRGLIAHTWRSLVDRSADWMDYIHESNNLHGSFIRLIGISSSAASPTSTTRSSVWAKWAAPGGGSQRTTRRLSWCWCCGPTKWRHIHNRGRGGRGLNLREMLHLRANRGSLYIGIAFICLSISEKLSKNKRRIIGPNLLFCSRAMLIFRDHSLTYPYWLP